MTTVEAPVFVNRLLYMHGAFCLSLYVIVLKYEQQFTCNQRASVILELESSRNLKS